MLAVLALAAQVAAAPPSASRPTTTVRVENLQGQTPLDQLAAVTSPEVLAECSPTDLAAAVACIEAKASPDERAILAKGGFSNLRGYYDPMLQYAWKLGDPAAPLSVWLSQRGLKAPQIQSAVILEEFALRAKGSSLDLAKVAVAAKDIPMRPAATKEMVQAVAASVTSSPTLSAEECAAQLKLPVEEILGCQKVGDRYRVMKKEKK
jgi:hypothetical protein